MAQSPNLYMGFQRACGLSPQTITVVGITYNQNMGSSMFGLTAGVGVDLVNNFELEAGFGYFLNFGASATSGSAGNSTSSQSFNVKRVSLGLANTFDFAD